MRYSFKQALSCLIYFCIYLRDYTEKDCPQTPSNTNVKSWATFYQEYVLRNSEPGEYFNEHIAGVMVSDNNNESTYTSWFSNEV